MYSESVYLCVYLCVWLTWEAASPPKWTADNLMTLQTWYATLYKIDGGRMYLVVVCVAW